MNDKKDGLSIEVLKEEQYLVANVSGTMSLGGVRELIDLVDSESKIHGCDLFLVDMLQTGPIANEIDRFYLGKYAALNLHLGLRVAIVYPTKFRNKLFENTATNRGATLIVVSEKEEGIKWLLEGIPN